MGAAYIFKRISTKQKNPETTPPDITPFFTRRKRQAGNFSEQFPKNTPIPQLLGV